ncbi:MAG: hypothetical protein JWN38_877 [Candidatus Saccharibacteria bacterium]|nr:hypothetical protein [Candidatus Saccharibacteria bacterium]
MLLLTIRTDKPEAELGLYEDTTQLSYYTWPAHRELAETIHVKIRDLLADQSKELHDVAAIVVFQGPGSFTGLRIGIATANALADGLGVPVVAEMSDDWVGKGIGRLLNGEADQVALPEYGAAPHITPQKK